MLVIDDLHELRSADALAWLELFLAQLPPRLRVVLATRRSPELGLHRLRLAGRADRDPRRRSALLAGGDARAAGGGRDHALGRGGGAAPRADRRLGGRPAAGGDLARRAPRPRALRDRVLRQRAHRGGLPAGGGAGAPAARGARAAAAHVGARARQRPAGRRPHRRLGLRARSCRSSRTPTRSSPRSTWGGRGSATTTCSPTCCGSSCAGPLPPSVAPLHRAAAQWYEEHGYPVEAIRHAQAARDWPHAARLLADNYVDLSSTAAGRRSARCWARSRPTRRRRTRSWRSPSPRPRSTTAVLDESAAYIALAERLADDGPRRAPAALRPAAGQRSRLRSRAARRPRHRAGGDARRWRRPWRPSRRRERALSNDHRAVALMNLGIAELWSSRLDDARRHLEQALALARRTGGRTWRSAASATSRSPVPGPARSLAVGLELSEQAVSDRRGARLEEDPVVAPRLAAGAMALLWLGRFDEAERWLERARARAAAGRRARHRADRPPAPRPPGLGQGQARGGAGGVPRPSGCRPCWPASTPSPWLRRRGCFRRRRGMGDVAAARAALADARAEERDGAEHAHRRSGHPPRRGGRRAGGRRRSRR